MNVGKEGVLIRDGSSSSMKSGGVGDEGAEGAEGRVVGC